METQQINSKSYFNTLKIIYFAMIFAQVFFGGIAFFLVNEADFEAGGTGLRDVLIYVVPVIVIGGVFGSTAIFTKTIFLSRSKTILSEKLIDYRSALIVKYAILEGAAFFAIVVYLLTADTIFLGMAGLIVMVFVLNKPGIGRAEMDLDLSPEEKNILNNPESIIN